MTWPRHWSPIGQLTVDAPHNQSLTRSRNRDRSLTWRASDGYDESWMNSTIAVRSSRNRTRFVVESIPQSSIGIFLRISSTIDARSWSDRGRSWSIVAIMVARMKQNHDQFVANSEATISPQRIGPTTPANRLPRLLQIASMTHKFGPISLYKSMYFPPLFFNFWSTREEIKRVSMKVLSSRDPLIPSV